MNEIAKLANFLKTYLLNKIHSIPYSNSIKFYENTKDYNKNYDLAQ